MSCQQQQAPGIYHVVDTVNNCEYWNIIPYPDSEEEDEEKNRKSQKRPTFTRAGWLRHQTKEEKHAALLEQAARWCE